MPTPKQVRFHFKRVENAWYRLLDAMTDAHNADVIVYDSTKYVEEGPCKAHRETKERFLKTTEKVLAQAMREEIRKSK